MIENKAEYKFKKYQIIEEDYQKIQTSLISKIDLTDKFKKEDIRNISGIDLAYWNSGGCDFAVCCIVTIDYKTKSVLELKSLIGKVEVPYIPGYLSFRELPLILKTFQQLEIDTDLVMFDGNGYLHYRNMGIATHASFYLKKPTIGIAKSYLKIDNTNYVMPENYDGAYTDIVVKGKKYGRAVRTHKAVKPIFVSCGNWITLDTATDIVLSLIDKESRQPLPTRLADIETRKQRTIARAGG
jgi:deoxyribonuclease V